MRWVWGEVVDVSLYHVWSKIQNKVCTFLTTPTLWVTVVFIRRLSNLKNIFYIRSSILVSPPPPAEFESMLSREQKTHISPQIWDITTPSHMECSNIIVRWVWWYDITPIICNRPGVPYQYHFRCREILNKQNCVIYKVCHYSPVYTVHISQSSSCFTKLTISP